MAKAIAEKFADESARYRRRPHLEAFSAPEFRSAQPSCLTAAPASPQGVDLRWALWLERDLATAHLHMPQRDWLLCMCCPIAR